MCSVPASDVCQYERSYLNPEYGAILFISSHHPSHQARVDACVRLGEMYPPELTEEQFAELQQWLIETAKELGINYAKENSSKPN